MAAAVRPVRDRDAMLRGMDPRLQEGEVVFQTVADADVTLLLPLARGLFREGEGVSMILPAAEVPEAPAFRQITLQVASDLEGVGLTAAVSGALAEAGIACNVVAARHHDHLFVPAARAEEALRILTALAAEAAMETAR